MHSAPMQEVKRWHQIEGWGFLPLYLYKLVGGALNPREGAMRTLYRVGLLVTFPGASPCQAPGCSGHLLLVNASWPLAACRRL